MLPSEVFRFESCEIHFKMLVKCWQTFLEYREAAAIIFMVEEKVPAVNFFEFQFFQFECKNFLDKIKKKVLILYNEKKIKNILSVIIAYHALNSNYQHDHSYKLCSTFYHEPMV